MEQRSNCQTWSWHQAVSQAPATIYHSSHGQSKPNWLELNALRGFLSVWWRALATQDPVHPDKPQQYWSEPDASCPNMSVQVYESYDMAALRWSPTSKETSKNCWSPHQIGHHHQTLPYLRTGSSPSWHSSLGMGSPKLATPSITHEQTTMAV